MNYPVNRPINKQIIVATIVAVLFVLMVFGSTSRMGSDSEIALTSSNPRNFARNINTSTNITLTYQNKLPSDYGKESLSIEPSIDADYVIEGNKLTIMPRHDLLYSTRYFVKLLTKDENSKEEVVVFTTRGSSDLKTVFINEVLPLITDGYWIDYVPSDNYFVITISREPSEEYINQALRVLEQNNITKESDDIRIRIRPNL